MIESPKLMYWIYRFVGIPDPKHVKVVMIASFGGRSNPCILPRTLPRAKQLTTLPQSSCLWRILWLDEFLVIISRGQWFRIWIAYSLLAKEAKTFEDSLKWNIFSHTHTQRKIYWLPFTAFSTWKFCSKLKSRFKGAILRVFLFPESLLGGFGILMNWMPLT